MIKIINLSKSFGSQEIFSNVSFNVNQGERCGLVGRNGHGKTTLFRMITGEEQPDDGEISIPKNYTIGYVEQHIGFTCKTILEEAASGLPNHMQDQVWVAEKILFGLGFSSKEMETSPADVSGGYQVRINLAKALVASPDMLLLDEPTNYLDIVSVRWLSDYLRKWKGELMLITHDRSFMDGVVTHTVGIHRKNIRKIAGDTSKYYEQIAKEEEIYEQTRLNDEKKRKETELFINRFRAKARLAGMVQSRIKALEKSDVKSRLEKIKTLDFNFTYKPMNAKNILSAKDLSFGYNDSEKLFSNLSFSIGSKDRLCIIGKNGKGKSTLLKVIAGKLKGSGEIIYHPTTAVSYYAQTNVIELNPSLTVEEEIMASGCDKQRARDICGLMMFSGDDALKTVGVLSGGEKARVLLGKMIVRPANLLLLDEPTNHLDMETSDAFLAAIDSFEGAVILVTHNEMFLNAVADKLIVFDKDNARLFDGSYSRFLENTGWSDERQLDETGYATAPKNKEEKTPTSAAGNKRDLRKRKAALRETRAKELKPLEEAAAEIERQISETEAAAAKLNAELVKAAEEGRGGDIGGLSLELKHAQAKTEELYETLDKITRKIDEKNAAFAAEEEDIG